MTFVRRLRAALATIGRSHFAWTPRFICAFAGHAGFRVVRATEWERDSFDSCSRQEKYDHDIPCRRCGVFPTGGWVMVGMGGSMGEPADADASV